VGLVELEPTRLTAPYTVTRGEVSATTELIYRFEEEVFRAGDPAFENLAAVAAAQVALNYGLFCKELVLRGPLDGADRRLLAEMAENTAREIYVNKLLEPNPFLVGLPPLPEDLDEPYLQAELVFPEAVDGTPAAALGQGLRPERLGVLASGGKDSLLSLGLLEEMGYEAHSLFVNESGRHWYTALNAYRHLAASRPATTARVWTTSDRVFSWMLRHLPFVREDFAQVRSDIYPIRLWTVAVFLFGCLPLAFHRGAGRVVIGDEYDTTVRARRGSIPHYAGLYDQSRTFDEALTRYYRRKGWSLSQFSLLRPLSELLIQRILATRYPELHEQQVSCHAGHLEGERVHPCGRCEKCRRVVGMHAALDADATGCGYTRDQVAACLEALKTEGLHQGRAEQEQLLWMLVEKGLLPAEGAGEVRARHRPEVLKLRFHPENSPPETIPGDLRESLYPILLQHADGAVERVGRTWLEVDPLQPAFLSRPYRFDRRGGSAGPGRRDTVLGEMTWVRARERLRETDTALLPVGATEQHGPHLPLDTDSWDAEYLCRRVAERCSQPQPVVLPLVPYGVSYHHQDFSGTLSVSPETLAQFVYEVGMSAVAHGVTKLIIVNGHGGNAPALQLAAQRINRDARIFTCVDTGESSDADVARLTVTPNDAHAGEIETSTALATRPQLVDLRAARRSVPRFSSRYLDFSSERSISWFSHTAHISKTGVLGDPTQASAEKGEAIWDLMIDALVAFVEQLKGLSLEEILQRRL
jgi:creatinine amidohydrolase/Fe(II)-dependent formamide hydrolase-like protein/7-cyano-7-deazaguanine synthase in queuosine biosynthesis